MTTVVVADAAGPLIEVARQVLTHDRLPRAALVGGLAVAIRVSAPGTPYRATADIDIVTDDAQPSLVEIVTGGAAADTIVIDGVAVDVIATAPVSEHDLDDLDAGSRLFVAGHRWALETAEPATVRTAGAATPALTVPVATPAGLLVSKTHALGYARAQRRSMKQGSDLLDIYRLVERHGSDDRLAAALHTAPGRLAPVVADVLRSAYLANPARAARRMDVPGSVRIDGTEIADVIGRFVDDLDRG